MMTRSTRSAAPTFQLAAELHADQDKGEGEISYRRVLTYGPKPPPGDQDQSKIEHLPVSLQASEELLQGGHSGESEDKAKALGR